MALAVCLLFDGPTERVLRRLWQRLEADGVPTLATHTHHGHVPHLSLAVLRSWDLGKVRDAMEALPDAGPAAVRFDAVAALGATEEELHKHYVPGIWTPHVTVATRVRLEQTPLVLEAAYEILPLTGTPSWAGSFVGAGHGRKCPYHTRISMNRHPK